MGTPTRPAALTLLLLCIGLTRAPSAAAATLTVPDGSALPGQQIVLPVQASGAVSEVGFQVEVAFNPGQLQALPSSQGGALCTVNNSTGVVIVSMVTTTLSPVSSGSYCALTFTVNAAVPLGTQIPLDVRALLMTDANGNELAGPHVLDDGVVQVGASPADLALSLSDTPDPVSAGATLSYLATASNQGPGSADQVAISLPLPAGTTFSAATPSSGGSLSAPAIGNNGTVTVTWNGATPVGQNRSVTVVADVPLGATGSLSATASVMANSTDPTPANNTASATTTVTPALALNVQASGASAVVINANPAPLAGTTNYVRQVGAGSSFTLTAPPTANGGSAQFQSWSNCDSSAGTQCQVTNIASNRTVTAQFAPATSIQLSVQPGTVSCGTPVTVSWTSAGFASCRRIAFSQCQGLTWNSNHASTVLPLNGARPELVCVRTPPPSGNFSVELRCTTAAGVTQTASQPVFITGSACQSPTTTPGTASAPAPQPDGTFVATIPVSNPGGSPLHAQVSEQPAVGSVELLVDSNQQLVLIYHPDPEQQTGRLVVQVRIIVGDGAGAQEYLYELVIPDAAFLIFGSGFE